MPVQVSGLLTPIYVDLRDPSCIGYFLHGDSGGSRKIRKVLPRILSEDDIVFDVGANYGLISAVCSPIARKVVCIEANRALIRNLERTFATFENVELCCNAVSNEDGFVEFFISETSVLSGLSSKNGKKTSRVPSQKIDSLVGVYGIPNVVKIDVEGSEELVFSGARQLISSENCPIIFFEALSEYELEKSKKIIQSLHSGDGKFYHVVSDGCIADVYAKKQSSDYLYVPGRYSSRTEALLN